MKSKERIGSGERYRRLCEVDTVQYTVNHARYIAFAIVFGHSLHCWRTANALCKLQCCKLPQDAHHHAYQSFPFRRLIPSSVRLITTVALPTKQLDRQPLHFVELVRFDVLLTSSGLSIGVGTRLGPFFWGPEDRYCIKCCPSLSPSLASFVSVMFLRVTNRHSV